MLKTWLGVILITVASGTLDAIGALYVSRAWHQSGLKLAPTAASFGLFVSGIVLYYPAVRLMRSAGVVTPEIQVSVWAVTMILGVAIGSGKFFQWPWGDQLLAISIVAGLTALIIRTGG